MIQRITSWAWVVLAASTIANGATVSFSVMDSQPSPAAVAAGAPQGAWIRMFFVTTDADILSIGRVAVTGDPLFQVAPPFGSNTAPPDPVFVALNPALEADSWITTPGLTTLLGADLPGDGVDTTFGDLSNDGPQTKFKFAQLTTAPREGGFRGYLSFSGYVAVAGATGPESFQFDFVDGLPEPATYVLSAICVLGLTAVRRRKSK